MPFELPISLDVTGRRCVVVGGGPAAASRTVTLVEAGADVVDVTADEYRPELLDGAFVAILTGEDSTDPATFFADAEARGVLVSSMDDVEHCHFAFPSIVRRGDLQLAISTGGRAPALSRRLRLHLEQLLPQAVTTLVDALGEAREAALPRRIAFAEWASRWRAAVADLDELVALCEAGRADEVRDRVVAAVSEEAASEEAA
ncbi:MAG: bifunctional precorrin-2 dehydrogenase/sirohydrochlorin ferrochelatase [Actinomycetota bacterium]|nr:bifunctional precorrin-2 dehydrogenase/sirohydrochlorin ferrochelatase [Actinomycetota bacterium]